MNDQLPAQPDATPIVLMDCHAHLCSSSFDQDRQLVLDRADAAGVKAIIAVSETMDDAVKNLALADQYPALLPAAGLYPEYASPEAAAEMLSFIRANRDRLAAIGEVGLDFWIAKEERQRGLQMEVFAAFIDLAGELDLPLNVHSRSAGRQAIKMLLDKNADRVQLHAFDGRYGAAMAAVEAGYFFSIPPSILRSRQKQKLVKNLPLTALLPESDSPVLGPDPTLRNEPANLVCVVSAIADLQKRNTREVAAALRSNTERLYRRTQL